MRILAAALLAAVTVSAYAQVLTTEVWVGKLDRSAGFAVSDLQNLSNHPGYDNQPAFFPDGARLLYTSEAGGLSDTGQGVNAVLVDLVSGTQTTLAEARGFSPTPASDGKNITMLREGGVWLHALDGKLLGPVVDTKEAGYYTRFDDRTWVLFMNDKERRIVIRDQKTKALETMATGAITAPYRVPGQRAVTFVSEDPFPMPENAAKDAKPSLVLRKLDLKTKKVTTLATLPFPTGGHHVWTSRGTILMASGGQIYEWSPEKPSEWTKVWSASEPDLQGITRIALSPKEDRIALVSVPRGATVVRESRAASNDALAKRNAEAVTSFFTNDGHLIASSGSEYDGTDSIQKGYADVFAERPDVVYVRTPESIEESRSDGAVSERGTWTGTWTTPAGPIEMRGQYLAVWRRSIGDNGTPAWRTQSELFVPMDCTGGGCAAR
jgi:hypothetical protein